MGDTIYCKRCKQDKDASMFVKDSSEDRYKMCSYCRGVKREYKRSATGYYNKRSRSNQQPQVGVITFVKD